MTALIEYVNVLRSRWRWVVWGVLLALLLTTVVLVVQPPLYRTTAAVFVRTPGDVSRVIDGGDSYAQSRARTYTTLAGSPSVSSRVIADLGLDLDPDVMSRRIHASNPRGTAIIDVAVSAPDAEEAQRTARVLLSEFASTVRALETVPGALVPRAELVVVDPPGPPVRVAAWGAPVLIVLLVAVLAGLVIGALGAVVRSIFAHSTTAEADPDPLDPDPMYDDDTIGSGRHHRLPTSSAQIPNGGS